ncbi:MAG: tetratricopeptide repeat protein [Candidatus Cloacimonetes bacterium]|nr:tetratricopeptide repeat protein [Candidatus Cloacimonadota bacterium]MCF7813034.1 tetratricopeptide repeat protein [Candidatus Cloacimonadota bacterium]MCF7867225.1 tetratricopeptide repeat protein [Candidatus Cloacimonadota bacterium]MCF7882669.1 tetratricopeptide repeat protein [Candidatus Cloacimonadota bacterium]
MKRIGWMVFIILMLASGCVYYNTFFNAEQYFKQAQETELRDNGKPTASAIQNYNKTIKKCGIVLTDYKDSKYADDALFLMARCFYYIGRNYTQAIKHFEDLIEFYPNSEFIPDARLYIAKCNYQFRRQEEAYELLKEFLQDPEMKNHYPKALKILADFHLENEDYVNADFYLNRLIENFPDSDEYEDAFFLKGKAQYEAGNYAASNEVFNSLLKSNVPRTMKLDARYYIARNHVLLDEAETGLKISNKLLKDEYRENHISKIQLQKARSLSGVERNDDAIALFETIVADNKRTELSAEALFFLGELYFNNLHNYEKAIENYNEVKKEYNQSEYVEQAVTKSAVASQIIQFNNPDSNIAVEDLVLQQFKLAEFYIEVLDMPDSALYVYDYIISQKNDLIARLDSMETKLLQEKAVYDSLKNIAASENDSILVDQASTDTLMIVELAQIDSLSQQEEIALDKTKTEEISKEESQKEIAQKDSLLNEEIALSDSLLNSVSTDSTSTEKQSIQALLMQQEANVNSTELYIERAKEDIKKYDSEFIPFAQFIKIWLYKNVYNDSLKINEVYQKMQDEHPENKYTYAANLMIHDKDVEIITKKEKEDLAEYADAIEPLSIQPEIAELKLEKIAADSLHTYNLKAKYSLGYLNHFVFQDTTKAKDFYNFVLEHDAENVYKPTINKFYVNKEFQTLSRLPKVVALEQKENQQKEEETKTEEELDQKSEQSEKEETEKLKREEAKQKEQKEKTSEPEKLKDKTDDNKKELNKQEPDKQEEQTNEEEQEIQNPAKEEQQEILQPQKEEQTNEQQNKNESEETKLKDEVPETENADEKSGDKEVEIKSENKNKENPKIDNEEAVSDSTGNKIKQNSTDSSTGKKNNEDQENEDTETAEETADPAEN